ncbi:MAG: hypothetical protein AB7H43_10710 [Acidimicrobiia bacterium]
MAVDVDEVVIAGNGQVYVAPLGTAGPTNIATALNAAFVELGYVSEEGVKLSPGMETKAIMAWQAFYGIRRIVTGRSLSAAMTLLQWSDVSIKLAFGGGSIATASGVHTYTPPDPEDIDYRAMVLAWQDGVKSYRLHLPRVMVTEVGDINLTRADAAGLAMTFSVDAVDGAQPLVLITDDAAFAEA